MHVPASNPLIDEAEISRVTDAIKKGEISSYVGGYIKEFEESFAKFCETKYALTVSNGTAALHLALLALGIKKDDEVLVSSFTMMSSVFAILYIGAKPVAIDSEPLTLNMDTTLLESKITPKTKVILAVHIYGHPVDMDPLLAVAKKHNLFVVEDCAEAHGALYKGKKVGSLGDVGCFSMYANKIVTTGEGGMVTTNDPRLAEKMFSLKTLAFGKEVKLMHQDVGFNYRLGNLQAAVGAGQMSKIDLLVDMKRKMAAFYLEHLKGIPELQLPIEKEYAKNVYWMFNIILRDGLSGKRKEFLDRLKTRGVETREDFVPFNQQDIFVEQGLVSRDECPVANSFYQDGFYLPSGPLITDEELSYVVDQVKEVAKELLN